MKSAVASRVEKHRANLRNKGLKPIQIWVPDIRSKGFAEECKRQSMLVKRSAGLCGPRQCLRENPNGALSLSVKKE